MIERYETSKMKEIWSEQNKYKTWLNIELAVCRAWNKAGVIPAEDLDNIEKNSSFDVERIKEIEATVNHDVIAFVTNVAENTGPSGRYIHLGMTSSDILDTASSLLIRESLEHILEKTRKVSESVLTLAQRTRFTPCVGRTHGIHAEPMTFGLKLLNWHSQFERDIKRLSEAVSVISFGKLSGAVGTYAHCPPEIEKEVCAELNLTPAPVSTQILQRDRHAQVISALSFVASTIERCATEIRHLQRTEVLEALEPFGKGQKGSSAMPHKKNPIICERLSGMARLLRGYASTAMENIALWHERDISHSSVERVIWPDSFHIADYMLDKFTTVTEGLNLNTENMKRNLDLTRGLVFSQRVLLELVDKFSFTREQAYSIVQNNAMKCWKGEGDFCDLLSVDPDISSIISRKELEKLFDYNYYYKYVDQIFERFSTR